MNIYQKKYLGWVKHGKTRRGKIKKGSKSTNQPLVLDADTQQQPTNVTGAVTRRGQVVCPLERFNFLAFPKDQPK